jgi:hypothetical protein
MNEKPMHPPSRHLLLIVVLVGIAGYIEQWLWTRQLNYVDEALNILFGAQQPQAVATQGRAAQTTGTAAKVTTGQLDADQARMQFNEGDAAGGLGQIRQSDGGAKTPAGRAGRLGHNICEQGLREFARPGEWGSRDIFKLFG